MEEEATKRLSEDCSKLVDIFARKTFSFDDENIFNVFRLGKREKYLEDREKYSENKNKCSNQEEIDKLKPPNPRPLIVKFKSFEYKKNVLNQCKELKYVTEDGLSIPIHYGMDLTRNERDQRKVLVAELNRKKEQGFSNLTIRNGQIVTQFQKEAQPFKKSWASLFKK